MTGSRAIVPAQLAIGLGLIALSALLAVGANRFPAEMGFVILPAYDYPRIVAGFLGVVGLLLSYQALTGGFRELDSGNGVIPGGKSGAAWVTGGLVGVAALINLIGFVLAAGL